MKPAAVADALLPGAGLAIDGRLGWGLPLLIPALLALSGLLVAWLIGGFAAAWATPRLLPVYVVLIAAALTIRWRLAARECIDPVRIHQLARAAARAWLRRDAQATALAQELTRAAPALPQAWRLLALVAEDPRAARRAEAIERRGTA